MNRDTQEVRSEMSERGKRKVKEEEENEEVVASDEGEGPPKKASKKDSDDTDNIVVCEISKNRRVSVRNWQGRIVVDIREFYVKDGKQLPGKKGLFFFFFFFHSHSLFWGLSFLFFKIQPRNELPNLNGIRN